MAKMTGVERMTATLRFQETDRPWFFPTIGFWEETLQRWHGEGLPRYVNEVLSFPYFGFDLWLPLIIGTHEQPGLFPPFMPKTVATEERHKVVRDMSGKTYREFTDGSSSIPQFLDSPVKNMDDFRALRWRLKADFPGRCINPLFDAMHAFGKVGGHPLGATLCGLFGFHRHLLGVEPLMTAYFDDPELLHAISREWVKLSRGVIRTLKKRYNMLFVMFWEDMCFRSGPLISPKTFRNFMTPYYKLVIDAAKEDGVEFFWVDTDGDCNLVIPLFMECGVNMMYPFEVQAGMDIRQVREKWPDLAIMGGLDKRALALTREDIEREVMEKVPHMLEKGGYMPALDHSVPPDVPMENFLYYLELLKGKAAYAV